MLNDRPTKTPDDVIQLMFDQDELRLEDFDHGWSEDEMFDKDGIFYLKDVACKLRMSTAELKKKASDLEKAGESPWEVMGIRRAWTHWLVRMKKFGNYLRNTTIVHVQAVQEDWDANDLLSKKGQFYLADVCDKIPFTTHQIRYQVRRNKNAEREYGVWKDAKHKTYIVEMEVFSKWIRQIWAKASVIP